MNIDYWMERDQENHMNTYARLPVVLTKGRATKVWDIDGRQYTDFLSGLGVLNLGHSPKEVVDAVAAQARELLHVSNLFYTRPQLELGAKLRGKTGGRCFFANSGAEANEGALKLARRWAKQTISADKTDFVATANSFHGRTFGTLTATGQPEKHTPFAPLMPGFSHVPYNDLSAMEQAVNARTCAVILEAVQGEGGVHPAAGGYLTGVKKICEQNGALLIIDEIQTGMGRTGKFFAFEHYDLKPDIITMAKSLAGGFPIGAVIARDDVAKAFKPGDHGSTFGGGPAICAGALAAIDSLEAKHLVERAETVGSYFSKALESLAAETGLITEVRGLGLMIGAALARENANVITLNMLHRGFIINNIGDSTLRFLPPLIITEAEIDELLAGLKEELIANG